MVFPEQFQILGPSIDFFLAFHAILLAAIKDRECAESGKNSMKAVSPRNDR